MKKMTKKYVNIALASLCTLCLGLGVGSMLVDAEGADGFTAVTYDETYALGANVEIDKRFYVEDGKQIPCTCVVSLPDGSHFQGENLEVDAAGKYTVTYTATSENQVYTDVIYFNALGGLAAIRGTGDYEEEPYYGESHLDGVNGILASIKEGQELFFKQPVDLRNVSKSQNIVTFFHRANSEGSKDAEFIVRLTDIYDASNYVQLVFRYYNNETKYYSYISASFPESDELGMRHHDGQYRGKKSTLIDGTYYEVDKNDGLGATVKYSVIGVKEADSVDSLSVTYDNNTKRIYVNGTIIADFDEPLLYGDVLFGGFTTGEVYVSISGQNYSNKYLNLCVTELYGANLQQNQFLDRTAPVIDVDTLGYETLPTALVGMNYPVFNATANDFLDGECPVDVRVYKNYYSEQRVFVSVKDGKFCPMSKGTYYIVYTTQDTTGNVAEKIVTVQAENKVRTLAVEASSPITTATAGQEIKLYDAISATGAIGNYDVKAYVQKDGSQEKTELKEQTFTPYSTGNYNLVVEATDYLGTVSKAYPFEVTEADGLVFIGQPTIENYFIKNQNYTLREYPAYELSAGEPQAVATKIYVSEDGGEFVEITNGVYKVNATQNVKVKYAATGVEFVTEEIPVQDVRFDNTKNVVNYVNMFAHNGFTTNATEANVTYTTNYAASGDKASLTFVNSVLASSFTFSFELYAEASNYSSVAITLTDVENAENSVTGRYFKQNDRIIFTVDGTDKNYTVSKEFSGTLPITFRYTNSSMELVGNDGVRAIVPEAFEGFASNLAYLTVEFEGIENLQGKETTIAACFVNGQKISSSPEDFREPDVLHVQQLGEVLLNEEFTIHSVFAKDVVDNDVTISYEIKDTNGNYAVSVDGVTLDKTADYTRSYQLKATSLGRYNVIITASDSNGNVNTKNKYVITVTERVKPVITLGSNYATNVRVGESVSIAAHTATDNINPDKCKMFIYVKDANGVLNRISDGKFKPTKAGTYEVIYVCYDGCDNMTNVSYKVYAN